MARPKNNFDIAAEREAGQEARYRQLYGDAQADVAVLRQSDYSVTVLEDGFLVDGRALDRSQVAELAERQRRLKAPAPEPAVARINSRTTAPPKLAVVERKQMNDQADEEISPNPITRTSVGLRDALFEEIDRLRNGQSTVHQARAVASLAAQIVSTVHMEIAVAQMRRNDPDASAPFLPPALKLNGPEN